MTVKFHDEKSVNQIQNDSLPVADAWKRASVILAIFLMVAIGYFIFNMQSQKKIPEAIVRHDLANFVISVRSISSDPIMIRRNLEDAYAFTTRKGGKQLDKILNGINLIDKVAQGIFVDVLIKSILKKHKTLYTISWFETEFQNSEMISKIEYEGFFKLQFYLIKRSKDSYLTNPSGIYINSIVIKKVANQKLES